MRLIGTLEARGYVVRNPDKRSYHPGIKLPILAKSFEKNNQVEIVIRPILKHLANDTGESATFYVIDGIERVALAREEGSHPLRYSISEGQRYMLHRGGASSKILLAFSPPECLEAVISAAPTDTRELVKSIETAKKHGYAVSKAENTAGAHSIAAPVFNVEGKLNGALTISGPSIRMADQQIEKWLTHVIDMAKYLSDRLGSCQTVKK